MRRQLDPSGWRHDCTAAREESRAMNKLRTEVELASLFAEYFGETLEPTQLERLVADVAAARVDRQAVAGGSGQPIALGHATIREVPIQPLP